MAVIQVYYDRLIELEYNEMEAYPVSCSIALLKGPIDSALQILALLLDISAMAGFCFGIGAIMLAETIRFLAEISVAAFQKYNRKHS